MRWPGLLALVVLGAGCAPRVLRVENRVLHHENTALQERVQELEGACHNPVDFDPEPTLETVHRYLDRAGYIHAWTGEGPIAMEFAGRNTELTVEIQLFEEAGVLFLTTRDYLHLEQAQDTEGATLLLVRAATLNYELLLGKLQLNPETGEILLSTELHLSDGLGYRSFLRALEALLQTADARYPDLERAAAGRGI